MIAKKHKLKLMHKILILFGSIFCGISCNETSKNLIVKKWKLIGTNVPVTDLAKQRMYREFLIQFTDKNKYRAGFKDLQDIGNYAFTKNEKSIIITDDKTKEVNEIIIIKLTNDTLKTKAKSKGFESVFVALH